ncbi:MAG: 2TM domain-containing protein [Oscillatoria sp. PMC 1068.18]|nr:2TM domain-containing protein [Oscillatoria sp. PMC 1068.18]
METPQTYRQEEIQQILATAIARQEYEDELPRTQLWEIAAELQISPESLQAAEIQWLSQRKDQEKRLAFEAYRKSKFKQKAGKFLIINSFLVGFNLLTAGTLSWSLYILLAWGLWLALHGWQTFQSEGEAYEQAYRSWERKHEIRSFVQNFWLKLRQALQA